MPKRKATQYLSEMEVILGCLALKEKDQDAFLAEKGRSDLKGVVSLYRASPASRDKLLAQYNHIKLERYRKTVRDPYHDARELKDERAVTVAKGFLLRYTEEGAEDPGGVPGFKGHGKQAGRKLLQAMPEENTRKRRVPPARAGRSVDRGGAAEAPVSVE